MKRSSLLLQESGVKGSVCQAPSGLAARGEWGETGWRWEEEDAERLLTLQSVLRSAGEPGYVTLLIMRGRPSRAPFVRESPSHVSR